MSLLAEAPIRLLERESIAAFVESCAEVFEGKRVLDFGCGKQPYRGIVEEAGGSYVGYDRTDLPANVSGRDEGPDDPLARKWDVVMATQVIQYVPLPREWLEAVRRAINPGGHLVVTGPTNWPIVEREDRWRFTPTGIASLLNEAGFFVETVERRASVMHSGEQWLLGWGALARA